MNTYRFFHPDKPLGVIKTHALTITFYNKPKIKFICVTKYSTFFNIIKRTLGSDMVDLFFRSGPNFP